MRKVIAAINMTLDGFCDHTSMVPDDEMHEHYRKLVSSAGVLLYGRITYQLMEFWPTLVKSPSGVKHMDDFALAMDKAPKIVFSRSLKSVDWHSAKLTTRDLKEEVLDLKKQPGGDIMVGSRSLIISLLNLNLVDEFQLCIQPTIAGSGLRLFDNVKERMELKLLKTKTFSGSGSTVFYYEPGR